MSRDLRMEPEIAFSSLKPPMDMTRTHLKKRVMNMSARDARFSMAEPSCAESCKSQLNGCLMCFDYIKRWWDGEFKE